MIEVDFLGGRLRVLPHRAGMHDFRSWEGTLRRAIFSELPAEPVVVSVGAEEGEFESYLSRCGAVAPSRMYLVEPSPLYWPNIKRVWGANVEALPGGCFAGFCAEAPSGPASSALTRAWPRASTGEVTRHGAFAFVDERPDIPARPLDALVAEWSVQPTTLMIDVEGAELRVMQGALETLRRGAVAYVAIHGAELLARYGTDEAGILAWCRRQGLATALLTRESHESHYRIGGVSS